MADLGGAIRTYLLTDDSLTNEIGTRIVPDQLDQNETMPAVVMRKISTRHYNTIHGSKAGMAASRITFDVYAATRASANAIAELIRLSGILDLSGVTNGVDIRDVEVDAGAAETTEQNTEGNHELRYITSQDYAIHYKETV